ncbi:HpcH/HpaI aldolase/citrate lyase family protein [Streptomyces melanosporofaciens]|uniref:Citrate lyase subunit beta / citryl-CoA lyase n=1 Tax=Streptomyces melanosporofaciens TaxID=67327 RepID=A0A1H4XQN1_STRMJ|nr:aldolase/citrate lyase family protein [Streptomyces melanosporofaciens]SED07181.1 citrate lyase subunit beta / citryl-CoA lyase [Streptomyces melanosporofaciens]
MSSDGATGATDAMDAMDATGVTPQRVPLRSLLFVPGSRTDWLPKAEAAGADAAILDLEDAVPEDGKAAAREAVAGAVAGAADQVTAGTPASMRLLVRINALDRATGWQGADDLRAVARPGLYGIVLPKVSGPEDVTTADRLLAWCEREHGLPEGHFALLPLLETARGLREAYAIGRAAARIAHLGAVTAPGGDVERAIGYRWSPEGEETRELRARALLDARAADRPHPVAGLWADVADLAGLRRFAEQNRALGYEGMAVIHPSHVPVVNEVFAPDAEELARCERLIAAVERAQAEGAGAVLFEGRMVDEAMAATARRTLARHEGG